MKKIQICFLACYLVVLGLLSSGCSANTAVKPIPGATQLASGQGLAAATVRVTVLNVGKADAILVQSGNKNVLVDTGYYNDGPELVSRLRKLGVDKLEAVIMTHPHADHIGGVLPLMHSFAIKSLYDTQLVNPDSKLYPLIVKQAEKKHIPRLLLQAPQTITITPEVKLEVLWPVAKHLQGTNSDVNANSAVMRLVYKKFAMLLTADSYKESEYAMLKQYTPEQLHAQVLKVAHHTSNSSTSWEWLEGVQPEVAVASYGNKEGVESNKYPNKHTLNRIQDKKIKFYGTYHQGDITITSDGEHYTVQTER